MKDNFQQLIKLLQLGDIRFMDSHESVLRIPENFLPDSNLSVESGQAYDKKNPIITGDCLLFRVKYVFSFLYSKEPYFKAEYIVNIFFKASDLKKVQELLQDEEVKKIFLEKQLTHTMWPILRGTLMNAFSRHSLHPSMLPWVV
jgi:hypothetical protein